jgi:hypothetical protein
VCRKLKISNDLSIESKICETYNCMILLMFETVCIHFLERINVQCKKKLSKEKKIESAINTASAHAIHV